MRRWSLVGSILALVLVAAACGDAGATLQVGEVPQEVEGNVVSLPFEVEGVSIVAPDGDTSGETGHFHVFIDQDPPEVGEIIDRTEGIVHSADNPTRLYGLGVGEHTFAVVIGDGTHTRFGEDLVDEVTVEVLGPSVQAEAPATLTEGDDLNIRLSAEGVDIVAADGSTSGESGHYHLFIDPTTSPQGGDVVPTDNERIIHTTGPTAAVSDLEAGEHTIWVVLGDGTHTAFDPPVMDRITVMVEEADEEE